MPDSDVHRHLHIKYGKFLLPVSVGVGFLFGGWYMGLWAGVGYVLHRVFDQDLDQIGISTSEAEWSKTLVLAPLVGWSTLYARIIQLFPAIFKFPKGHRSFWSHFPPVGAMLRLLFFWAPFYFIFKMIWIDSLFNEFWGLYIGLMVADWVHSLADWKTDSNPALIYKWKKEVKSKLKRRKN